MNRSSSFRKQDFPKFKQVIEKDKNRSFPISFTSPGEKVRVVSLVGGRNMCQRLIGMGINIGSEVTVIKTGSSGPCLVAVDSARFAIGAGMAQRIMVVPIS